MRKLRIYILSAGLIAAYFVLSPGASGEAVARPVSQELCEGNLLQGPFTSADISLEESAESSLAAIWPEADPEVIREAGRDFVAAARAGRQTRPTALAEQDRISDPNWMLRAAETAFYVNQLGVSQANGTFYSAARLLKFQKQIGFDLVYPFPFLQSPGKDAGFDVSNFEHVSEKLGGDKGFDYFAGQAKALGMKIKMDLIMNHVSDEHPWFQAFLKGDMRYKDYFHVLDHPPDIVKKVTNEYGRIITYREKDKNGREILVDRRVIFPDVSDTHYREVEVPVNGQKKKFWVYYTFYPFQIDLNFDNPQVLKEFYYIINHWANKGIDVFRLDAIPFLNKLRESDPQAHHIVQLLNLYLRQVAPNTLLMPEACQPADVISAYFGKSTEIENDYLQEKIPTTTEAQIAYNFESMPNMWASLASGDKRFYIEAQQRIPDPPENAAFANFLRIHDELTLEMVTSEVRQLVYNDFSVNGRGVGFREGLGVAGRTADFLRSNPDRIVMAYSVLFAQKGMPIVYYGDEIMAHNNFDYANTEAQNRDEFFKRNGIQAKSSFDARDVNRGPIPFEDFLEASREGDSTPRGKVLQAMKRMLHIRRRRASIVDGKTLILNNNKESVLSFQRLLPGGESTTVVANLAGEAQVVQIQLNPGIRSSLRDLLSGKDIVFWQENGAIAIRLAPYESLWLDTSKI